MSGPDRAVREREAYAGERAFWLRQAGSHFDEADLPFIRWHQQRVRDNFAILRTETLAEVGCGAGKLFRDHDKVLLIDFSPEILARAKREMPQVLAVCASVEALPFRDGSLARIVANNMLHHVKGEGLLAAAVTSFAACSVPTAGLRQRPQPDTAAPRHHAR